MKNNTIFRTTLMAIAVALLAAGCAVAPRNEVIDKPVLVGKDAQGRDVYQKCVGTAYGQQTGPQMTQVNCYHVYADGAMVSGTLISHASASTPAMADVAVGGIVPAAIQAGGMIGAAKVVRPAVNTNKAGATSINTGGGNTTNSGNVTQ